MAGDDPSKQLSVSLTPVTKGGAPSIIDDQYNQAVGLALQGGDHTQDYFDARNETADFWSWMANTLDHKENPWAEGVDPQGNPILMCSNGNLDMRMGTFWRGPDEGLTSEHADQDDPPIFAITSIQTHNTTNNLSGDITFGVGLVSIPPGIVLTKKLFADAIKPIYSNAKLAVGKLVQKFRSSSETENPNIDPEEEVDDPLTEASDTIEDVSGELAEQGAEYMAIEWGSVGLETAGLVALGAIPLILQFLAHQMFNSMQIINRTDLDFTLNLLDLVHGVTSVEPVGGDKSTLPKMDYNTDSWGDKTTVKVAYESNFQFVNWSEYGSIGHVIGLTPSDGGTTAKVVTSVPWAGDNTIWVGQDDAEPAVVYENHSDPDGKLTQSATFGNYSVAMAINKLSGETDNRYFYGVLVTIDKTS